MSENIIDAKSLFIGKRLLDSLENRIYDYREKYHPFYTTYEMDGKEWLELCLKDLENNSIIVVDMNPIEKWETMEEGWFTD